MLPGASLTIFETAEDLHKEAAQAVADTAVAALRERGICTLVLSGGETPRPIYRLLGSSPLREQVDWKGVHILFGDERMVPPDDPQSNFRMVKTELLDRISIPPQNVHRIAGDVDPVSAARVYENVLEKLLSGTDSRPDLILLGLGSDGHTASLFPPSRENATSHKVLAVYVEKLNGWRVTMTSSFINSARRVLFIVTGREKAATLQRVLDQETPSPLLPATSIRPTGGDCLWMVDRDAAALIPNSSR